MNFSLDWYDPEHTILYMRFEDVWEIDVAQRAVEIYQQKVLEVPHQVDLIAQALDKNATNLPLWLLRVGVKSIVTAPPNAGLIVLVPNHTKILALTDAGIRVLGKHYTGRLHTAASFDDAYQLIQTLRKS